MKILFIFLLSTQFLYAQEADHKLKQTNLKAQDGAYYSSKAGASFVISKQKFTSHAEAKSFCTKHLMPMAGEFELLALAMMGINNEEDLMKSIGFKFETPTGKASGIWTWSNEIVEGNDVVIFQDGKGTSTQFVKSAELKPAMEKMKIPGISAMCARMPAMDENMVDESGRDIVPEKSVPKAKAKSQPAKAKHK